MRRIVEFLQSESGQVNAGGPVIYVIILGLFFAIAAAMGSQDGPRHLAGHAGPTLELDIRGMIERTFGGPLPQIGPIGR